MTLTALRLPKDRPVELVDAGFVVRNVAVLDLKMPGELLVREPGAREWRHVCICTAQRMLAIHLPRSSTMMARGGELHLLGQQAAEEEESGEESDESGDEELQEALDELDRDLAEWEALCAQRRALADAAATRGTSWEEQARAQGLPLSKAGLALHRRCDKVIGKHGLEQGVALELDATLRAMALRRRKGAFRTTDVYSGWDAVPGLPSTPGLRAVASDALSFPLTAAWLASAAGARPDTAGELRLLVLGPESHSELAGRRKWAAALGAMPPAVRLLRILFVGPAVPAALDGAIEAYELDETGGGGRVELAFLRGAFSAVASRAPPAFSGRLSLALAFHPGLAEHCADWAASLRLLVGAGVPLGLTSYHPPEAELDARALALKVGGELAFSAEENPLASLLPHLDGLFPGRTYAANAHVTLAMPEGGGEEEGGSGEEEEGFGEEARGGKRRRQ